MEIIYPNSLELEEAVLGSILSNRIAYNEVRDVVNENCFYNDFLKKAYLIFKEIESTGEEPDSFSVALEFHKKHGGDKFTDLVSLTSFSEVNQVYNHTLRLLDLHSRRQIIDLGAKIQRLATISDQDTEEIVNLAKNTLNNLYRDHKEEVSTIREAINGVYSIIDRNASGSSQLTGSQTGFELFDKKAGGLQKSDLIIIAGETSQGKTSFALSIVNNTALSGQKVAIYSLEMKKEQLASRLMAMNSGVASNRLLYSRLESYEFERLDKSINGLCNSCILFDDRSTSNIDTIIRSIRSMVLKYGIDGVVIDYLQILNVNMKGSNKEQQMGDVARRLKNLAKELDIWIIALSQLNRDFNNPVPNINRLRDSGQIAEASDVVMFVYRPEYYGKSFPEPFEQYETQGYAMIDLAKGRNIGLLKMLCEFDKETTHFKNVDKENIPFSTPKQKEINTPF